MIAAVFHNDNLDFTITFLSACFHLTLNMRDVKVRNSIGDQIIFNVDLISYLIKDYNDHIIRKKIRKKLMFILDSHRM